MKSTKISFSDYIIFARMSLDRLNDIEYEDCSPENLSVAISCISKSLTEVIKALNIINTPNGGLVITSEESND